MVLLEAALVIGLVSAAVYAGVRLLMRMTDSRPAAVGQGQWRVTHYDHRGATKVVLQKVTPAGTHVLDEHLIETIPVDAVDYDERFMTAMNTARQRQAVFEAEEG